MRPCAKKARTMKTGAMRMKGENIAARIATHDPEDVRTINVPVRGRALMERMNGVRAKSAAWYMTGLREPGRPLEYREACR